MRDELIQFEEIMTKATADLLAAYGKACGHAGRAGPPATTEEQMLIATIGLAAKEVCGNLTMLCSRQVAKAMEPEDLVIENDDAACEMMGEFSNMLLGRMKNRLLLHGVQVMMGMPTTAIARELRVNGDTNASTTWNCFTVEQGSLYIRLEVSFDEAFRFVDVAESVGPMGTEGDVMMF